MNTLSNNSYEPPAPVSHAKYEHYIDASEYFYELHCAQAQPVRPLNNLETESFRNRQTYKNWKQQTFYSNLYTSNAILGFEHLLRNRPDPTPLKIANL